jgi:hypothetical protein
MEISQKEKKKLEKDQEEEHENEEQGNVENDTQTTPPIGEKIKSHPKERSMHKQKKMKY